MIVYKKWHVVSTVGFGSSKEIHWDGWFLFGILALYVRQKTI